ncbi:MAG: HYR domain-containing protein, partial [Gammaproteobacteria bacterium]|nr:HYR domain-containing protein [Gammaproteobacteria bacterium]
LTVELDATGNATITEADINNGSADNCGIASLSIDNTDFNCDNVGSGATAENVYAQVVVTYVGGSKSYNIPESALQNWSNYGACDRKISTGGLEGFVWTDDLAPSTVVTDVHIEISADFGGTGATKPYYLNGTLEGSLPFVPPTGSSCTPDIVVRNLSAANYIVGGSNSFTYDLGASTYIIIPSDVSAYSGTVSNVVTLTVIDIYGNESTCQVEVTVEDNIAPAITCPADISVNTDAGVCESVVTYTTPVGTDNCTPTTTQTAGSGSGATFSVGTTTETYEVTDESGNTASCSFTVAVTDNEVPTALCQTLTVELDATGNATITEADINNGSADNCGIASLSIDNTDFN